MTTARRRLKVKIIGQGQCKNVCATRVSTAASYEYWLTTVMVGIYCHVISCALGRRDMRRGCCRCQRQRRSQTRVGVVTLSVWPRFSIEDCFSSFYTRSKNGRRLQGMWMHAEIFHLGFSHWKILSVFKLCFFPNPYRLLRMTAINVGLKQE